MKANELMIGDWVKISHLNKIGKVYRIDSANGEGNGFAAVIDGDYHESNLEPIPLTTEILEKNGFHKEWDEDIILMMCDTVIVEIGNMYKIYKDGKMYLRRVLAPLYYVHELQHALRLCRIEKEIIL